MLLRFFLILAALGVSSFIYLKFVRPRLHDEFSVFYSRADGFWNNIFAWLKLRWDMALAAFAIVAPELPGLLTDLSSVDLSGLNPPETVKAVLKVIGILAVISRVLILRAVKGG